MTAVAEELLLSAEDCKIRMAEAEAEKALEYARKQSAAEAEKRHCSTAFSNRPACPMTSGFAARRQSSIGPSTTV